MKTKDEKFIEFQYELEIQKKKTIWISIAALLVCGFFGYNIGKMFITPIWVTIVITAFMTIMGMVLIYQNPVQWLNMEYRIQKLRKKIENEKEYLTRIKEEYIIISSCKFKDIPVNLRETARYLLSNRGKGPEEIIKFREEEIENHEVWLQVFLKSSKRNFWQYLISIKWLQMKTTKMTLA